MVELLPLCHSVMARKNGVLRAFENKREIGF